jgi:hypothetical protein
METAGEWSRTMPFAGPETTLVATILLAAEGDFLHDKIRALAGSQPRSTTFQQLARRLNNFRRTFQGRPDPSAQPTRPSAQHRRSQTYLEELPAQRADFRQPSFRA